MKWLRLEDARRLARGDPWLVAELKDDIPGLYIADTLDRYKVWFDVLERDARGDLHRRQRTATFKRGEPYDVDGEMVDAWTAAKRYRIDRKIEVTLQREQAKDVTLADVFDLYVRSRQLRESTASVYRYLFDKHVAPQLGGWSLRNLDLHAIERWYADLEAGPEAKAKTARLLRSLTAFAYRRGMIPTDPGRVLMVTASRVRSLRPDEIPTGEQVAALADAVGERYHALVLLLAFGGLRIGEAVALRVDRVDFTRRRITVDASATEVSGRLVFGSPKTAAGVRTFAAPRFLIDVLREHVERFPSDRGLIFTGPNGAPVRPGNFRRRVFDPAATRSGLDGLHLHDLRHTAASTLASHGASATEIAHRLGHASAATTQRIYLHLLASRDERLAEMQDEAHRSGAPA